MPLPREWEDAIAAWREDPSRPSGMIGLADLAREAYALSAALLATVPAQVSCAKGCAACCREVIPLSPPEALLLAETHAGLTWERRAESEERRARNFAALKAAGLADAPLLDRAAEVFAMRLDCPYLENESCGIHPDRPLACREHLAVSPSEWCAGFPDPSIRMLELPASVGEALAALAAGLMGYREAVPMARLADWLEANRDWAGREWRAGLLLDALARICLGGEPADLGLPECGQHLF